jgi:hypothetical protein
MIFLVRILVKSYKYIYVVFMKSSFIVSFIEYINYKMNHTVHKKSYVYVYYLTITYKVRIKGYSKELYIWYQWKLNEMDICNKKYDLGIKLSLLTIIHRACTTHYDNNFHHNLSNDAWSDVASKQVIQLQSIFYRKIGVIESQLRQVLTLYQNFWRCIK